MLVAAAGHATDAPHNPPRLTQYCLDCHTLHNAPGTTLTAAAGNHNLCMSCHNPTGLASPRPFAAADQAVPGTTGNSHRFDALAINPVRETLEPLTPALNLALAGATSNPNKRVMCSTCHNQHDQTNAPFDPKAPAGNAWGRHYQRIANNTNQMCLDCHRTRDLNSVRTWTGSNLSHPVQQPLPATSTFHWPPNDADGSPQASALVGVATSGSTTTLVNGAGGWTPAALVGQVVRFRTGVNKGATRPVIANTATTLTFAALPSPITAGDGFEIDRDGNLSNNFLLDDNGTPSYTQGRVLCMSCHSPHFADSNSATYDEPGSTGPGDGFLLKRTNDGNLCMGCHDLKVHNSTNTSTKHGTWGTSFTCRTCHQPHATQNLLLIKPTISTPNSGDHAVDLRAMTQAGANEPNGLADSTNQGAGPCETCHTDTRNGPEVTLGLATFTAGGLTVSCVGTCSWASSVGANFEVRAVTDPPGAWTKVASVTDTVLTLTEGYKGASGTGVAYKAANPRFRNTGSGTGAGTGAIPHHITSQCTGCHSHANGFAPKESQGNRRCSDCHLWGITVAETNRAESYHHVVELDNQVTAGTTEYATFAPGASPTPSTADNDKRCTQCHADHNVFSPDLNAQSTGRGNVLRVTKGAAPVPGAAPGLAGGYQNKEYDQAQPDKGVCLSCHQNSMTKNQVDQKSDGTSVTWAIDPNWLATTAHNFTVPGNFANGPGSGAFSVMCLKCHSDTNNLATPFQDGPFKFALHASVDRRLRNPLGVTSPADGREEDFCFRCHSKSTETDTPGGGPPKATLDRDYYGQTPMTANAQDLWTAFKKGKADPTTNLIYFKRSTEPLTGGSVPPGPQTGDTFAGGTWALRSVSPGPSGTAAYDTWSQATNLAGTQRWRMVTFCSPPVLVAATMPAGNWVIRLNARESNGGQNAYIRYHVYEWLASGVKGSTFVAPATNNTELNTNALPGPLRTITVAGATASIAVGDRVCVDLELETRSTTTTSYTASFSFGGTAPGRLTMPANLRFDLSTYPVGAGRRHDVMAYNLIHRPTETDETQAYLGANKHIECEDCHNPHAAKAGIHTPGGLLADGSDGNLAANSGPLTGARGFVPTYTPGAPPWTPPTGYTSISPVQKEHQVCFRCHTGANPGLASWDPEWTNLALEFSPNNRSAHPVQYALGDAARTNATNPKQLTAAQMKAPWNTKNLSTVTMFCSDCHGSDQDFASGAATTVARGPHASAATFIKKGPGIYWPTKADGTTLYSLNDSVAGLSGLFCTNCHPVRDSGGYKNNAHTEMNDRNPNIACTGCHVLVPHGSKMSRLIGSRNNMPARYAYQNNPANNLVTAFSKASGPNNYSENNCANSCSGGKHPTTAGTRETW